MRTGASPGASPLVVGRMDQLSIPLILGTRRIGRRSEQVAELVLAQLARFERVRAELIDLALYDLPLLERRDDQPGAGITDALRFSDMLGRSDAILIVTPEYKNGYPGALKNALDYLRTDVLRRKPVGIVTVSSEPHGGVNCLAQLRLVCLALGAVPIPDAFPVANVRELFDEDGILRVPEFEQRTQRFLQEFLWYTEAFRNHRSRVAEFK